MFEETVGDNFLRYAYMPEYRLARQLFHFVVDGLHSNEDKIAADKFFEDSTELYGSVMQEAIEEIEQH